MATAASSSTTKLSTPRSTALKRLLNQNNNNITTINDLFNDNNNNIKRNKLSINDHNNESSYSSPSQSNNDEEEEEEEEEAEEEEEEEEYNENEQQQQLKQEQIEEEEEENEDKSIKESIKSIENNQKLLMLKMDLIIETFKYFQNNFITKNKFKNCMKNVIFNDNNNVSIYIPSLPPSIYLFLYYLRLINKIVNNIIILNYY
jgi:hypothetical protein